jgi:hypothetical protein
MPGAWDSDVCHLDRRHIGQSIFACGVALRRCCPCRYAVPAIAPAKAERYDTTAMGRPWLSQATWSLVIPPSVQPMGRPRPTFQRRGPDTFEGVVADTVLEPHVPHRKPDKFCGRLHHNWRSVEGGHPILRAAQGLSVTARSGPGLKNAHRVGSGVWQFNEKPVTEGRYVNVPDVLQQLPGIGVVKIQSLKEPVYRYCRNISGVAIYCQSGTLDTVEQMRLRSDRKERYWGKAGSLRTQVFRSENV